MRVRRPWRIWPPSTLTDWPTAVLLDSPSALLPGPPSRPLSVVMIDVDNFKHINDTFGHAAGDHVLKAVAGRMQSVLRRSDILGRYGGDEFVMLLPETGQEGARRMTERLRAAVATLGEEVGKIDAPVTLSIGITSAVSMANVTLDALLQYADKALYVSKGGGRDRVTSYETELGPKGNHPTNRRSH